MNPDSNSEQDNGKNSYCLPPYEIEQLVDGVSNPAFILNPTGKWAIIADRPELPSIRELSKPTLKLAGLQWHADTYLPHDIRWFDSEGVRLRQVLVDKKQEGVKNDSHDINFAKHLPLNSHCQYFSWRCDGMSIAFVLRLSNPPSAAEEFQVWVINLKHKFKNSATSDIFLEAKKVCNGPLYGIRHRPINWLRATKKLIVRIATKNSTPPKKTAVPTGPLIQENTGATKPARTYQNLLKSPYDDDIFEFYTTHRLCVCSVANDDSQEYAIQDLDSVGHTYASVDLSPDGTKLLVYITQKPYSRLVPARRFAVSVQVWDLRNSLININESVQVFSRDQVCVVPAQESKHISFDARPKGPRGIKWHWLESATLVYCEALDGGDPRVTNLGPDAYRDAIFLVRGPNFQIQTPSQATGQPPICVFKTDLRVLKVAWCKSGAWIVEDKWRKSRRRRLWILQAEDAVLISSENKHFIRQHWIKVPVFDRQYENRYKSPGNCGVVINVETGCRQVQTDPEGSLVLFGDGASPRGNRPFIDTMSLKSGDNFTRKRVWRCVAGPLSSECTEDHKLTKSYYEQEKKRNLALENADSEVWGRFVHENTRQAIYQHPVEIFWRPDNLSCHLLIRQESKTDTPNYRLLDISRCTYGQRIPYMTITNFPHPQPSLLGVKKELIQYTRADGVSLDAQLFFPPGYDKKRDGRRPCLCWTYPAEFKSKKAAGQVRSSPFRFVRAHWSRPLPWLLRGWVVLERFACPIVAEGDDEPNDTFIDQICSSAAAAVDTVTAKGIVDPKKVAVGGHSYGAFMTVHLLSHSNIFCAGIARSGAYNRTLTPFGFQGEERTFWDNPQTYLDMSPFSHAKKLAKSKRPLLLIHGEDDENSGTHPIQSDRLYHALKGLGGVVRLVKLPFERHTYRARESILHTLFEQDNWLRQHVENVVTSPTSCDDSIGDDDINGRMKKRRMKMAVMLTTSLLSVLWVKWASSQ